MIQAAPSMQLYLDSELPLAAAGELLDSMTWLLAGAATPEQVIAQVSDAWQAAG